MTAVTISKVIHSDWHPTNKLISSEAMQIMRTKKETEEKIKNI